MPRVSDHEEYLNATMIKDGDTLVLLDQGAYKDPEETGLDRTVFHIKVGLPDQRQKLWSMNKTTQRELAAAYGDDTVGWVNKGVRVEILSQKVRGETKQVLYGHPAEVPALQPQQAKMDVKALARTDRIIAETAKFQNMTVEEVEKIVEDERGKFGGLLTEESAALIVAQRLGVNLEGLGIKV